MATMAMATATKCVKAMVTRWRATKKAMARGARAMTTATKRAMASVAMAMATMTKRANAMDGESNGC